MKHASPRRPIAVIHSEDKAQPSKNQQPASQHDQKHRQNTLQAAQKHPQSAKRAQKGENALGERYFFYNHFISDYFYRIFANG